MPTTIQIEESLHDVLKETDLLSFQHKLAAEKQLTKIEHFDHVKDAELVSYGLSEPAVRRLRNAFDRRKKAKKSKLFSKPKPSKFINADCELPTSSSTANGSNTSHSLDSSATPSLISRDDVKLMEQIGQGGFATVKRGIWQRSGSLVKIDCAVKVLHQMSPQALEDLHAEISHMQKLKHQNVIQLYGIVFGEPTMLIIEFCDGGSLLDRLRNTKKPVLLVTKLLSYALQIASGMAYLENRHVIHRDLALRNILLAENEEVVKICDFGMTRSLEENERFYCMSGQKKVPFGWCPPESLRFRQFSHKSDCWAFGVTLWELYSYGEEPWIGHRAADVLRVTEQGEQLKKPRKCLQEIYEIMQMCWAITPELRPKFSHLRNLLLDIKFMTAETRESYISDDPDSLELSIGEHVVIISEDAQKEWYGQSVASRKFGKFPHSLVSVKSHRVSDMPDPSTVGISSPSAMAALSSSTNAYRQQRNKQISKPIPGSLIHTGHGDTDQNKCWGNIDHIDEIYLKNPVIRPPPGSETRSRGVSFISSITALHDDIVTTPNTNNSKVRPISSNPIKLDFDPLKAWDLPTPQSETSVSSFPSKMPIPLRPPPPSINTKPRTASEISSKVASPFEVDWNQTPIAIPSFSKYEGASRQIPTNNGETTNISAINHRRNQTQPIVLPSVVPKTQINTIETQENDPFYVDPNLKNLSIKPKPIEWRQAPIMNDHPRPQSARLNETFSFPTKVEPLDQSILALLDPLLSNNTKIPPQQIAPKTEIKPVISTAAVPRPQSNFNTAPSALNVLAYVSSTNKPNGQPKLSSQQTTVPQSTQAWTYLPPTTSVSTIVPAKSTTQSNSSKYALPGTSPSTSKPAKIVQTAKSPYVPISSLLPPPSELAVSTNNAGSLLPPPSELLLSGLKAANSKGMDSAYGSLTSNSSASRLTLNTGDVVAPQQTQQLFNIQQSPISAYNMHQKNMIITQNNQQMFLDSNGIPFLLPTPIEPKSSQPSQTVSNKPQTIISLNDLDIDSMILNVKKKVDFATQEQCSKALRLSDYDVDKAIEYLKIDKLIEMGLCVDRSIAARALTSTDWNVNEAALKLVS